MTMQQEDQIDQGIVIGEIRTDQGVAIREIRIDQAIINQGDKNRQYRPHFSKSPF